MLECSKLQNNYKIYNPENQEIIIYFSEEKLGFFTKLLKLSLAKPS